MKITKVSTDIVEDLKDEIHDLNIEIVDLTKELTLAESENTKLQKAIDGINIGHDLVITMRLNEFNSLQVSHATQDKAHEELLREYDHLSMSMKHLRLDFLRALSIAEAIRCNGRNFLDTTNFKELMNWSYARILEETKSIK